MSKYHQTIYCSVESCQNHGKNDLCMLYNIQINPLTSGANSPDESMCECFERKDD